VRKTDTKDQYEAQTGAGKKRHPWGGVNRKGNPGASPILIRVLGVEGWGTAIGSRNGAVGIGKKAKKRGNAFCKFK